MKINVLTPTIGTPDLMGAVESVARQTHADVEHIIVADGKRYESDVRKFGMKGWPGIGFTPRFYSIPHNTGANGWNGHKIYAYYSQLLDCDYLLLLDEDNAYEPDHVEMLIPIAERHGYAWSLRKVYDKGGNYIGTDTAESIGLHLNGAGYALVDTSCWCLRRDMIPMLGHFLEPWSGDRRFTEAMILRHGGIQAGCSGKATMLYSAPDHLIQHFTNVCTP
jgi:glycosyltransferase involved in cell wall biosynthesis